MATMALDPPTDASANTDYVTLVSCDDYSFVVKRSVVISSKLIKQMLDPDCKLSGNNHAVAIRAMPISHEDRSRK